MPIISDFSIFRLVNSMWEMRWNRSFSYPALAILVPANPSDEENFATIFMAMRLGSYFLLRK